MCSWGGKKWLKEGDGFVPCHVDTASKRLCSVLLVCSFGKLSGRTSIAGWELTKCLVTSSISRLAARAAQQAGTVPAYSRVS